MKAICCGHSVHRHLELTDYREKPRPTVRQWICLTGFCKCKTLQKAKRNIRKANTRVAPLLVQSNKDAESIDVTIYPA